jgi:uncharacterized protein (DUF3820 family)
MKLRFGKYKGLQFEDTPKSYQKWLLSQKWFKAPKQKKTLPLHQQLNGWDGHSRKGQAVYDAIFELEKAEALKQDCREGICTCCEGSMYYGL